MGRRSSRFRFDAYAKAGYRILTNRTNTVGFIFNTAIETLTPVLTAAFGFVKNLQ
jgi:hypothetical protein